MPKSVGLITYLSQYSFINFFINKLDLLGHSKLYPKNVDIRGKNI